MSETEIRDFFRMNDMFEHADKNGHSFYLAFDSIDSKGELSKKYTSTVDCKDYYARVEEKIQKKEGIAFYEIVREGKPVKLFADLEWNTTWKPIDEVIETFISLVKMKIPSMDSDDLVVLSACDGEKGSLHIINPQIVFENMDAQAIFWNAIRLETDKREDLQFIEDTGKSYVQKTFIDYCVYNKNRQFRLPFSSKMRKDKSYKRPLLPYKSTIKFSDACISVVKNGMANYDVSGFPSAMILGKRTMWSKDFLNHMLKEYDVSVKEFKNNLIILNNIGTRKCPINGEDNESDNAYLTISGNKIFYCCHDEGCKHKKKLIHEEKEDLFEEIPMKDWMRTLFSAKTKVNFNQIHLSILRDMNKYFAVITGSQKPYVMYRYNNGQTAGWLSKTAKDLKETFAGTKYALTLGDDKVRGDLIDDWFKWGDRKEYLQCDCLPIGDEALSPKTLNLFEGFKIQKNEAYEKGNADIEHWKAFIKSAWCEGKNDLYDFVIKWFAHLVQYPMRKMKSSIVLQGKEGVGKGSIVQTLFKIIGKQYCVQPTSPDDVFGGFNYLLENKALIFMDEMFYGGDKKHAGALKKLLTEETITTNCKYMPQKVMSNRMNFIFASNEDWILPAGQTSRRFCVLRVGDDMYKMTKEEKEAIYNVCPYSVAKYLYSIDLTSFDSSEILTTDALLFQKMESMNTIHKWAYSVLWNDGDGFMDGKEKLKEDVYFNFLESTKDKYASRVIFWKKLKNILEYEEVRRTKDGKQKRYVIFDTIEKSKEKFELLYKQSMFDEKITDILEDTDTSNSTRTTENPMLED